MNVYESVLEALLEPEDSKTLFWMFEDRRKAVRFAWMVEARDLGKSQVGDFGDAYLVAVFSRDIKPQVIMSLKEAACGKHYHDLSGECQVDLAIGMLLADRADFTKTVGVYGNYNGYEFHTRAYVVPELSECGESYNVRAWMDDAFSNTGRTEIMEATEVCDANDGQGIGRVVEEIRADIARVATDVRKLNLPWEQAKAKIVEAFVP